MGAAFGPDKPERNHLFSQQAETVPLIDTDPRQQGGNAKSASLADQVYTTHIAAM